jgi:hypothetical protein
MLLTKASVMSAYHLPILRAVNGGSLIKWKKSSTKETVAIWNLVDCTWTRWHGRRQYSRLSKITSGRRRNDASLTSLAMTRHNRLLIVLLLLSLFTVTGCEELKGLIPRDASSLLVPRFRRSELFGFVAGLGTTFAAVPDLIAMHRSVRVWV